MKKPLLEDFYLEIHDLLSNCFDFGLFSKNFLAPSVTFKFSRTKVITNALFSSSSHPIQCSFINFQLNSALVITLVLENLNVTDGAKKFLLKRPKSKQ